MANVDLNTVKKDFAGTTISGVEMQVAFGFHKYYFKGKNPAGELKFDKLVQITETKDMYWFVIGTVTQIRYAMQRDASPKYVMSDMNPVSIGKGVRFVQGDMIWKNLNEDSVQQVLGKIVKADKGIDINTINTQFLSASTVATLTAADIEAKTENTIFKSETKYWDQLPLFDIMCISKTSNYGNAVSKLVIHDVKVTDVGFAESTDSTELNDIVQFVAISGVESWKEETPSGN